VKGSVYFIAQFYRVVG